MFSYRLETESSNKSISLLRSSAPNLKGSLRRHLDSERMSLLVKDQLIYKSLDSLNWKDFDRQVENKETKSYWWVPMALLIGIVYSLADVLLSNTKSHHGFAAIGFLGPINVVGVGLYRFIQAAMLRYKTGSWIDYENSNYWVMD